MVVVLQHVKSLKFLGRDGGWTPAAERALDFGVVVRALDYALSRGLKDVRPVIKCRRNPRWDVSLPPVSRKH